MTTPDEHLRRAVQGVRQALQARRGWSSARVEFVAWLGHATASFAVVDHLGKTHVGPPLFSSTLSALAALREAQANPGGYGAWLSMTLDLDADGRVAAAYNYDHRVYVNGPSGFTRDASLLTGEAEPSDDDLREDFQRYPRSFEHSPAWYPRPAVLRTRREGQEVRHAAALAAKPDAPEELRPLADGKLWRPLLAAADQAVVDQLRWGRFPMLEPDQDATSRPFYLDLLGQTAYRDVYEPEIATRPRSLLLDLHREAVDAGVAPARDYGPPDRADSPVRYEMDDHLAAPLRDVARLVGVAVASSIAERLGALAAFEVQEPWRGRLPGEEAREHRVLRSLIESMQDVDWSMADLVFARGRQMALFVTDGLGRRVASVPDYRLQRPLSSLLAKRDPLDTTRLAQVVTARVAPGGAAEVYYDWRAAGDAWGWPSTS